MKDIIILPNIIKVKKKFEKKIYLDSNLIIELIY